MAGDRTSKSQEKRKSSKPLMEKRRRARINECLTDLQGILEATTDAQGETTGGHSKREKAEILEQTVELVKRLRHQDQLGMSNEPPPQAQYRAGFNKCLNEVGRFMEANNSALNAETRTGLLNHLAGSLGSGWSNGASLHRQFVPGLGSVLPREVALHHGRPSADRPVAAPGAVAATVVHRAPHALATPPKVTVPPLPPAQPPPTAPSVGSHQLLQAGANATNAIPVQQSPRKGEHPTAASVPLPPPPTSANPRVTLTVGIPQAPAPTGHVALVLPAHLVGSFVGGQFATGQVIPLYHQLSGFPGVGQQHAPTPSVALPAGSVGGASPGDGPGSRLDSDSAVSSSSVGAAPVFIVPNPNAGCSSHATPNHARLGPPATSSVQAHRAGLPATPPNPSSAPNSGGVTAMETRHQNGVVYGPASLPMQLYVAPSAYGGGANGPFANGLSLPNPPAFSMGPHCRPWGWDQDKR